MKMTAKGKGALEASIKEWESKRSKFNPHNVELGTASCPLCEVYHARENPTVPVRSCCDGCPIKETTRQRFCRCTPFESARRSLEGWEVAFENLTTNTNVIKAYRDYWRDKATQMINFMKDIRDDEAN